MPRIYNNIVNNLSQREICYKNRFSTPSSTSNQIVKSFFGLSNSLYKTDLYFHQGCVNALQFSNDGAFMVSGGDDMEVVLTNVEQSLMKNYKPKRMQMRHRGNIFCLNLNHDTTKILSGGTDEQLIIHDAETGNLVTSRFLDSTISDISVNPQNSNVASISCEDGHVYLFDLRNNKSFESFNQNFFSESSSFKSIQYNPYKPHLLLAASSFEKDVSLIDLRNQQIVFQYLSPFSKLKGAMCARYNSQGDQILVIRNRLPGSLYLENNSNCVCEFDSYGLFSSLTKKNICFSGPNDEFVTIPSDDFNVYLFKIPENLKSESEKNLIKFVNNADFVLRGHQSIVNQVHYNHKRSILATSGVETVIKYWSAFPLNFDDEINEQNLSTTSNERELNPSPSQLFVFDTEDSNHPNIHDGMVLNYFDNLIRHCSCDDYDIEDFIDLNDETDPQFELVDPQFENDLKYIESLIYDFKMNGEQLREFAIKQLVREKIKDSRQNPKMVSTRNISYIFNNKKVKQSKIILRRASKLIQDRLRFIRKLKKAEDKNDENWLENVQGLIDNEPKLKEILIDLSKMYKEKRKLELISLPLYNNLQDRLTRLFFTRPIRFLASLNDENSSPSSTDIEEMDQDENLDHQESEITSSSESEINDQEINNGISPKKTSESIEQKPNKSEKSDQYITDSETYSSKSNKYENDFSDDSLSAGSVLNEDEEDKKLKNDKGKNLKRKKSTNELNRFSNNFFNFNLFSSSDDSNSSDDDDKPFRRFKRSRRTDKTKKYNSIAFDSDLDLNQSQLSSDSAENPMKASSSTSKNKRSCFTFLNDKKSHKKKLVKEEFDFIEELEKDTKKSLDKDDEYFNDSDSSSSTNYLNGNLK